MRSLADVCACVCINTETFRGTECVCVCVCVGKGIIDFGAGNRFISRAKRSVFSFLVGIEC